jgi:dipeptidyl aminopeptidase/acylaminoacyl peptidase
MQTVTAVRRLALRGLQGLALLLFVSALATARAEIQSPPRVNYKQARKFSAANLRPLTYDTAVLPNWIGNTDTFWYSFRTSKGTNYWRVDAAAGTRSELFDKEKLASQLAELSRKPIDSLSLPITRTQVNSEGKKLTFVHGELLYEYDLKGEKLVSKGKAPPAPRIPEGGRGTGFGRRRTSDADDEAQEKEKLDEKEEEKEKEIDRTKGDPRTPGRARPTKATSPDRKWVLYTEKHNLYLAEAGKEKEAIPLSRDGAEDYSFMLAVGFGPMAPRGLTPRAPVWSKDSQHFYATRMDSRGVKDLFVINSLANPRPTLQKYRYPMPGEEAIRKTELHVGSREARAILRVKPKWQDESYSDLHWGKTAEELRFVRQDRLRRNIDLCAINTRTGECKTLISEGFENAPVDHQQPRYLETSDEMIWWSERSGWGHYYLYDRQGKLKNAITTGSWRASRIVALDEKNRVLYFQANGREKAENIYYQHLYSINLDGSGLTLLDPGDASHLSSLSPSRKYVVDNSSRMDEAPSSVLRDDRGNKIMDLEKADLSRLKEYGWCMPETFTVKAADGVTDLFGNMWKPFDFDPKKKYPIIAHVYPGPQTEGVTHTFSAASTNMQLAQLGFIVVQVGHRGGAPTRSKAYASYGYYNLRDYGLEDKKSAIEQLAARHPWIDIKKVGIYGHSGGGFMSAAALLQKPYNEFFTAAVASAGNHDNNIYNNTWAERYHGLKEVAVKTDAKDKTKGTTRSKTRGSPDEKESPAAPPARSKFEIKVPTNAELAANLKGRLLLVHGELDTNVHPANTIRLVDALIKANKRFDMLILPGKGHGFADYQPYFTQRMWEFFAEHLLGDRRVGADLSDKGSE